MKYIHDEWVSQEDSGVEYGGKIKLYSSKMYKWEPGTWELSSSFKMRDSEFQIIIFPNGKTYKQEGFLSVFMKNENDYNIKVSFEIRQ